MSYEQEEQDIIDDETLTKKERKEALRDLYWGYADQQALENNK